MPEIIIVPALFGTMAFMVWTIVNAWQRRQHLKLITELNTRLLERMGSVKDFSEFLQTPGGAQFLDTVTADKGAIGPRDRILRTVQTGIIISSVGLGCVLLQGYLARLDIDGARVFAIFGGLLLSLGIGCLLAAGGSYAVGKRLGVLR